MVSNEGSHVGGHPLAFLESFYGMGGQPDIEFVVDELVGDAVEMFVDFNVVVDVDGGQFPFGVLVKVCREEKVRWANRSVQTVLGAIV